MLKTNAVFKGDMFYLSLYNEYSISMLFRLDGNAVNLKKKFYLEISYTRAVLLNKYEVVKMNSFNSLDIFQGL